MDNKVLDSKIIGIIGDRGDGKSCLETIILKKAFDQGITVYSNYWLKFTDQDHYISFEEMALLPDYLRSAYIGMDEIQMAMDSREFLSSSNKALTKLITQIRKRDLTLIYTTQRLSYGDKRLRQQTDYLMFPEKVAPFTHNGLYIDTLFKCYVQEVKTGELVNEFYFDGFEISDQGLYDTNEIIEFSKGGSDNDTGSKE